MGSLILICTAAIVLVALIVRLWTLAVRIDRLHRRVLQSRSVLDRALVKRAATCLQIADFGILEPSAASKLSTAAKTALAPVDVPISADKLKGQGMVAFDPDPAKTAERLLTESKLTRAIRQNLDETAKIAFRTDKVGAPLLEEFGRACYKVQVARRLHNQDVSQVRQLRAKPSARFFHLAGLAALPDFIDLDDETS